MAEINKCISLLLNDTHNNLTSWNDWIIFFTNPKCLWNLQPVLLFTQILIFFGGFITFIHAYKNGVKWLYVWFAILINGFLLELLCYFVPTIDNFWHSQTPVMLFGRRLPLHILFTYSVLYYPAFFVVSSMNIKKYAKPFAGLLAVLNDIPYDIVGVKFLQWTWHDTDPNVYDRHYWVPWTSYYFHSTFSAAIFVLITHTWKDIALIFPVAFVATFVTFGAFYHPLHDIFGVHSEVIVVAYLSIYAVVMWLNVQNAPAVSANSRDAKSIELLRWFYTIYYIFFLVVVLVGKPEKQISVGLHQPLGACNVTEPVYTLSGKILQRKTYLCVEDYGEDYFDVHCQLGRNITDFKRPLNLYAVCGTPFQNRVEYITVISTICIVGISVYHGLCNRSQFNIIKQKSM